jgi:type IV secretion system protein VirB1
VPTLIALFVGCGVLGHADVLAAIASVESGGNPLALAVNGEFELVRTPHDLSEAVGMARWLVEHGHNFDAGLAQVNSANLRRLGLDVLTVFDRCANARAASQVLEECYARAAERWRDEARTRAAAVSCYNTGHLTRGIANGYVQAVLGARARWQAAARDRALGLATTASGPKRSPTSCSVPPPGTCCSPCTGAFEDRRGDAFRVAPRTEDAP